MDEKNLYEQLPLWGNSPEPYQVHVLADILEILPADISSILDVGCGDGYITNALPDKIRVVGLDISSEALKYVKREKIESTIINIPFPDKSFDLVMVNDVLEHLPDNEYYEALSELQRVAKKHILITVPFMEYLPAGYVQCGSCREVYHINYHYRNYNIAKLQNLLSKEWIPIAHIVSGAEWEHELPEIIEYKRSLGIYNNISGICPKCGKSKPASDLVNLKFIDKIEAYCASVRNSLNKPWEGRTECITLYTQDCRDNCSWLPRISGLVSNAFKSINVVSNNSSSNVINFNEHPLYKVNSLPRKKVRPYFYANNFNFDSLKDGLTVQKGESIKTGFFTLEEGSLYVKGSSEKVAAISIAFYNDDGGYRFVNSVKVSGEFEFCIHEIAPMSEYGRLYEFTSLDSAVCFYSIKYGEKSIGESYYDISRLNDARYLQIMEGDTPVLLSLPWYNSFSPSEVDFKEQLARSIAEKNYLTIFSSIIIFMQEDARNAKLELTRARLETKEVKQDALQARQEAEVAKQEAARARQEAEEAIQKAALAREQAGEAKVEGARLRHEAAEALQKTSLAGQEATRARKEAEDAKQEAVQAQKEAEEAKQEAVQARKEAEDAKQEAVQARKEAHPKYLFKRAATGLFRRLPFINLFLRNVKKTIDQEGDPILQLLKPSAVHPAYTQIAATREVKKFLMICHDQDIDRRIVQEAQSLIELGWKGIIIGLSYNNDDNLDYVNDIPVHRIGLSRAIPECPVFEKYNKRQYWLLRNIYNRGHSVFKGKMGAVVNKSFRLFSLLNICLYRLSLYVVYQNRSIFHPLPFTRCFVEASRLYPSEMVFAHDLTALRAGSLIAKEWNAKLIYDAHELYYEQAAFSKKQKKIMRKEENTFISSCNLVMTVNQSIAEEMGRRYSIPDPKVLLNAVDILTDKNEDYSLHCNLRVKCGIGDDKSILLYQGGIIPRRNLELIVGAMRLVKREDIVLVLMGNGSYKDYLIKLRDKKQLKNVIFVDAVPQSELIYWTSSADAGIIPYPHLDINTYYCTPNKLFEFIQAGIPILANESPELRRFVTDNAFGITTPMRSAKEIARAIELFFDKNLDNWKENIISKRNEFSWSTEKRKLLGYLDLR